MVCLCITLFLLVWEGLSGYSTTEWFVSKRRRNYKSRCKYVDYVIACTVLAEFLMATVSAIFAKPRYMQLVRENWRYNSKKIYSFESLGGERGWIFSGYLYRNSRGPMFFYGVFKNLIFPMHLKYLKADWDNE